MLSTQPNIWWRCLPLAWRSLSMLAISRLSGWLFQWPYLVICRYFIVANQGWLQWRTHTLMGLSFQLTLITLRQTQSSKAVIFQPFFVSKWIFGDFHICVRLSVNHPAIASLCRMSWLLLSSFLTVEPRNAKLRNRVKLRRAVEGYYRNKIYEHSNYSRDMWKTINEVLNKKQCSVTLGSVCMSVN